MSSAPMSAEPATAYRDDKRHWWWLPLFVAISPVLGIGLTAMDKAVDKIIAKGKKIAAHLLEASDTDIEFENGVFKVAGTDTAISGLSAPPSTRYL